MPTLAFPAHAAAVTTWKADHNHALAIPRGPGERRILATVQALQTFVDATTDDDGRLDPFECENILSPMANALRDMLNLDRGRFDGGKVDGWVVEVCADAGWDLDTERRITREA